MRDDSRTGQKLTRTGGDKGLSLGERISHAVHRLQYGTPLHKMRLKGRFPLKLLAVPADPVDGDAARGALVTEGMLSRDGTSIPMREFVAGLGTAPEPWREWAHGFSWLRDLAAAASRDEGAGVAEKFVRQWLTGFTEFEPFAWRGDILGRRMLFWMAYAPWILAGNDLVHRSNVLNHLARGARHLERAIDKTPEGLPRLWAVGGLLGAGLLLPGGEARQAKAEAQLARALDGFLLPDGGVTSRAPLDVLETLELLLLLNATYAARGWRASEPVAAGLARAVPGLKAVTLGDGRLTAMHGGGNAPAARIAAALERAGIMDRATRNGRYSGVQRLEAGRTVLVFDAGPPPVARASTWAHAGTLAFEMSDGAQRLVVNCGGASGLAKPLHADLAAGLRTTAAHSTLVLADTNSTRIREDGTLGRGIEEVVMARRESEEGQWVEATHDGYVRRHALVHRRSLYLSADGLDLRGEDALEAPQGKVSRKMAGQRFDVRFHLSPDVEATPTADGQGALLQLPGGALWTIKARGGTVALDDSVVIDPAGRPVPTQQIVVSGTTGPNGATVNWSLKRAR